jgi:hypothetical protein
MKTAIYWIFGALILAGCGCVVVRTPGSDDTSRLDTLRQQAPDLVDSVKKFYRAVQERDWPTTYDMRTSTFKQDVTRQYYLEELAKGLWCLRTYRVLHVQSYSDGGGCHAAEIIMDFDHGASYGCARWKKVNGVWLCDEPGLGGQNGMLQSLRVPDWVSH